MTLSEERQKELVQIAKDLLADKIFSNYHIPENNGTSLGLIFLPLCFINPDENIIPKDVVLIYEYYDKQVSGRCINGFPIFGSFRYLVKEECEFMMSQYDRIKAILDSI